MIARLLKDRRGSAAEFAITLPILMLMFFGIIQVGILYYAQAGLENAIGEGARFATVWPRRTDAEIRSMITTSTFGINPVYLASPTVAHGTSNGSDYVDITVTYAPPTVMPFLGLPAMTLHETRRAYLP